MSEHTLANTILTISARYYTLPGVGGASRSYAIHDRLWRYTRTLLSKLPFSGSRAVRTYNMVESLLLLTEWHPRNYHFPEDDPTEQYIPAGNEFAFIIDRQRIEHRAHWSLRTSQTECAGNFLSLLRTTDFQGCSLPMPSVWLTT